MKESVGSRATVRRQLILDAARTCFLRFGFAKTSLEDVAKHAGISRPLIYRKFQSKEDIFAAVLEDIFEKQYPAAERALANPGNKRDRLLAVYEALLLEPWEELIADAPMGAEFYEACSRVAPEIAERRKKLQLKYTQAILGTKEASEVFMLAVDGICQDLPVARVLRKRLEILIDQFVRDS